MTGAEGAPRLPCSTSHRQGFCSVSVLEAQTAVPLGSACGPGVLQGPVWPRVTLPCLHEPLGRRHPPSQVSPLRRRRKPR